MAASDNVIEVGIGVDQSGVRSGMNAAASSISQTIKSIQDSFKGFAGAISSSMGSSASSTANATKQMADSFKSANVDITKSVSSMHGSLMQFKGSLIGLAAAFGVFKGISALKEEAAELTKLENILGINTEEANKLNVALHLVGLQTEDYTDMVFKLNRKLKESPESFEHSGIKIKDLNGKMLSQNEIMQNTIQRLQNTKAGLDRNTFAQDHFGRGVAEAIKLGKLNNDVMKDAAKLADEYGVGLDGRTKESVKKFNLEMYKFKLVSQDALQKLGEIALPILNDFMKSVNSISPASLKTFGDALRVVGDIAVTVFSAVKDVIGSVISGAITLFSDIASSASTNFGNSVPDNISKTTYFFGLLRVGIAMMSAGLSMAVNEIEHMFAYLYASVKSSFNAIFEYFDKFINKIKSGDFANAVGAANQAMRQSIIASNKELADIENKAANKNNEILKKRDVKIESIVNETNGVKKPQDSSAANKGTLGYSSLQTNKNDSVMKKYEAELSELKKSFFYQNDMHEMSREEEAQFWKDKLKITSAGADVINQVTKKANDLQMSADKDARDQARKYAQVDIDTQKEKGLLLLDEKAKNNEDLLANEIITQEQFLVNQKKFEDEKFEIQKRALEDHKNLLNPQFDIEEIIKTNSQIELLEVQHQNNLLDIRRKAKNENNKFYTDMFASVKSGFKSTLSEFLKGGMSISKFMKNIMTNILDSITNAIASMVTELIANWAMAAQFGAATTGETSRLAIGASAAQAGAAATASAAAIPFYGWAMAPEIGAATYASTLAYEALVPFAEKGYDIPAGVNPLTQLHEKEMVLPKEQADTIRNMGANGGGSGTNITIHAVDADSIKKLFKANGAAIVDALKGQSRNFKMS